jgi:rare lipoprotein A
MARRLATAAAALSLLLAIACATAPKRRPAAVPPPPAAVEGLASWYGPGFNGKRTSNGERYDQDGLTAAHCCWPFGTRLRVTFLATGKSVIVRINDRMPTNPKGRIIDLSRGAARKIGLIGPGTGKVRLEVVS